MLLDWVCGSIGWLVKLKSFGIFAKVSSNNKKDAIELVAYNPKWPQIAALEIKKLREALPTIAKANLRNNPNVTE